MISTAPDADWPDGLLAAVEDAGLNATAPPQQRWLDGWLVRTWPGSARRSRCINALGTGRRPLADRVSEAERLCRTQAVPLLFRITPFTQPPDLQGALATLGFQAVDLSWVMVTDRLEPRRGNDPPGLERVSHETFAEIVGAMRGTPSSDRTLLATRLHRAPVEHLGFVLRPSPEAPPSACGQVVLDGPLAGLYDVVVAASERGRGWGRRLCHMLLDVAAAQGAQRAYLQVDAANVPARALYRELGFRDAYTYHYLERAGDPTPPHAHPAPA